MSTIYVLPTQKGEGREGVGALAGGLRTWQARRMQDMLARCGLHLEYPTRDDLASREALLRNKKARRRGRPTE